MSLSYDSGHSYCLPNDYPMVFKPIVKTCNRIFRYRKASQKQLYINRYDNSLYFIDNEINKILSVIKTKKLLDNTIIIITGDHGQAFNDYGRGYWEHAGNFTPAQIQTPLMVYWPGRAPKQIQYQTSHYDIAPTLLKHTLGCTNPAQDYTLGATLFKVHKRPYLLAASYVNLGIIEAKRITELSPSGRFQVMDKRAKVLPLAKTQCEYCRARISGS